MERFFAPLMIPPAWPARLSAAVGRWLRNPWLRITALFLYYLGILIALLIIYGRGDFTTAPFVYQGF